MVRTASGLYNLTTARREIPNAAAEHGFPTSKVIVMALQPSYLISIRCLRIQSHGVVSRKPHSNLTSKKENTKLVIGILVILPKLLAVALCKSLVRPILLLPSLKASIQHQHLLLGLVRRLALCRRYTLPQVAQRSTRSSLLAQGAVKDYRLLVLQTPQQRGHHDVELRAGSVDASPDVTANVIFNKKKSVNIIEYA